jgi:hypothetical protein
METIRMLNTSASLILYYLQGCHSTGRPIFGVKVGTGQGHDF